MEAESLIVVGDGYAAFGKNDSVITAGRLIDMLAYANAQPPAQRVILGLGIDEQQRQYIARRLDELNVCVLNPNVGPASLDLTHKTDVDNVLISELGVLNEFEYACQLRLGNCSDRLSDHVTGQHVGAMILMESARQAGIAALELALQRGRCSFMLQRFDSQYLSYAFPVPTNLHILVTLKNDGMAKQVSATLNILFSQASVEVARIEIDVTVSDADLLSRIETRRASDAARRTVRAAVPALELQ